MPIPASQRPEQHAKGSLNHAGATWRSGYATVCKTVYPGSIPGVASNIRAVPPIQCSLPAPLSLAPAAKAARSCLRRRIGAAAPAAGENVAAARERAWRSARNLLRGATLTDRLFRGSSAVEQPAVNRLVVGSNPTRGANVLDIGSLRDRSTAPAIRLQALLRHTTYWRWLSPCGDASEQSHPAHLYLRVACIQCEQAG